MEPETRALPERLLLRNVPDGLRAVPAPGTRHDRRGHLRVRMAELVASDPVSTSPQLADAELGWILATESRRWPSIKARFGEDAYIRACEFVRAGVVTLHCPVLDAVALGEPVRWDLTPPWAEHRRQRLLERQGEAETWRSRADAAADSVEDLDTQLAAALRRTQDWQGRLPVLVFAAEDLVAGVVHDGPRAFSQSHFNDTKARGDVTETLLAVGADHATVVALGLERSPYIGIGGPVMLSGLDLARLRGPVQLRANDPALDQIVVADRSTTLVIVENLQAAEHVCDAFPDLVTVYSAGQPSPHALRAIATLANQVSAILLIPDADLGGCRIAHRVLTAINSGHRVQLVDIGEFAATKGRTFGPASREGLSRLAESTKPVSALAQACLQRGYAVEQEEATRAAIASALRRQDSRQPAE